MVSGTMVDRESGEPLLIDGETVTASNTFVIGAVNGQVKVAFTFDE